MCQIGRNTGIADYHRHTGGNQYKVTDELTKRLDVYAEQKRAEYRTLRYSELQMLRL